MAPASYTGVRTVILEERTMSEHEPYVGRPLKRTEDPRLIRGEGQYVDDLQLPGMTHLAFLRSPYPHARVLAIRTDVARKAPGVIAVVTAGDLPPLRPTPFMAVLPGLKSWPYQAMADRVVDAAGVPVAAVVAESASLARDAADLIEVEYEPLPVVSDPERALAAGAPLVHPELGTNQAFSVPMKGGDVEAAFARADHVVTVRLEHNRLAGAPMEPRGVTARYDRGTGELTVWLTTQNPFLARADLATVLSFPEEKLRVIAPDVGGGFGVKGPVYREEIVAAVLACRLGRPVHWMSSRSEDLLTTHHGRATVTTAEAAVQSDGQVVGLRVNATFDLGAHLLSLSLVPPLSSATHVLGPYRIQNVALTSVGAYTNTAPTGPYRGSGRPVGVYLIERVMDEAARVSSRTIASCAASRSRRAGAARSWASASPPTSSPPTWRVGRAGSCAWSAAAGSPRSPAPVPTARDTRPRSPRSSPTTSASRSTT
jgi:carbon-monoxide dehydrogenase large subunit